MSSTPAREAKLFDDEAHDYDAILIVSFGGPEGPADVLPFLDNVLRGLPVTAETKARIAKRYEAFGGVSPINGQVRQFIDALKNELDAHGPALPVYWGNRNWHPMLSDTIRQMAADGIERAVAYVTSVFGSYSGCRKYREDLYAACVGVERAPRIDKLRLGFNHPGFVTAAAQRVGDALAELPESHRSHAPVLFSAHSLPESMARHAAYEAQLNETCRLIGAALEHPRWQLVYQSNNAQYGRETWLGPDVCDAIESLAAEGAEEVVVAPIGFVCDHLEVVLDLDVEAAAAARRVGVHMVRAGTVGTHAAYVGMVRDLIVERMSPQPTRHALGSLGPSHDLCASDCCLSGRPGPAKPAMCGVDSPPLPRTGAEP
jgi:ferrochelatase